MDSERGGKLGRERDERVKRGADVREQDAGEGRGCSAGVRWMVND